MRTAPSRSAVVLELAVGQLGGVPQRQRLLELLVGLLGVAALEVLRAAAS